MSTLFKLMRVTGQREASEIYLKCGSYPSFRTMINKVKETEEIVLEDLDLMHCGSIYSNFSGIRLINCVFNSKCSNSYGAFINAKVEFTEYFKTNHSDLYHQSLTAFEKIDESLRTGVEKCRSGKVDRMTSDEVVSVAEWLMSVRSTVEYLEKTSPLSAEIKQKLAGYNPDDEESWRKILLENRKLTSGEMG